MSATVSRSVFAYRQLQTLPYIDMSLCCTSVSCFRAAMSSKKMIITHLTDIHPIGLDLSSKLLVLAD